MFGDQSSSSFVDRRRREATRSSSTSSIVVGDSVVRSDVLRAQRRVRSSGYIVPANVPHPNTNLFSVPVDPMSEAQRNERKEKQ